MCEILSLPVKWLRQRRSVFFILWVCWHSKDKVYAYAKTWRYIAQTHLMQLNINKHLYMHYAYLTLSYACKTVSLKMFGHTLDFLYSVCQLDFVHKCQLVRMTSMCPKLQYLRFWCLPRSQLHKWFSFIFIM